MVNLGSKSRSERSKKSATVVALVCFSYRMSGAFYLVYSRHCTTRVRMLISIAIPFETT